MPPRVDPRVTRACHDEGVSTWRPFATTNDDPRRLGDSLNRVADSLGGPAVGILTTVFAHWADAVGAQIAAHARPVSLAKGVLVVAVDQPAWATQLRFLSAEVLARLEQAAGTPVATHIEVRVASPKAPRRARKLAG